MTLPEPPTPDPRPKDVGAGEAMPAPSPRGPVRERSPLPDVLRGVALAGILIVNMQDFAGFNEWTQTGPDRVAQVLTDVLANGRFISIFAMLFGWGAAGLIARQGVGTFLRRHAALLAIGTAHYVLVWHGDIISLYALVGAFMLLTARMEARPLLVLAAALGAWWLNLTVQAGLSSVSEPGGRFSNLPELLATYPANVHLRAGEFGGMLAGSALYNGPWLLALFCLGAAAQRSGLLTRPHEHRPLLRRLALGGLLLGVPLGALLAYVNTRPEYALGLLAIPVRMGGGLASALGYVGVLGLLAASGRLGVWRHFAASGRLAMSNYVAQSVVMTTVFYPYAGAQWGRWGALSTLALALALALLQLPVSRWWLARAGTGPMEWLVRALVYGRPTRERR